MFNRMGVQLKIWISISDAIGTIASPIPGMVAASSATPPSTGPTVFAGRIPPQDLFGDVSLHLRALPSSSWSWWSLPPSLRSATSPSHSRGKFRRLQCISRPVRSFSRDYLESNLTLEPFTLFILHSNLLKAKFSNVKHKVCDDFWPAVRKD